MNKVKTGKSADNLGVAEQGMNLVAAELTKLGASSVSPVKRTRKNELLVINRNGSREFRVRVKTKSHIWPAWQSAVVLDKPSRVLKNSRDEKGYWVFVDLGERESSPRFWVVPESWILNDIYQTHQRYLDSHGGKRPRSPDSTHHKIGEDRLERWQDNWDILGL